MLSSLLTNWILFFLFSFLLFFFLPPLFSKFNHLINIPSIALSWHQNPLPNIFLTYIMYVHNVAENEGEGKRKRERERESNSSRELIIIILWVGFRNLSFLFCVVLYWFMLRICNVVENHNHEEEMEFFRDPFRKTARDHMYFFLVHWFAKGTFWWW